MNKYTSECVGVELVNELPGDNKNKSFTLSQPVSQLGR